MDLKNSLLGKDLNDADVLELNKITEKKKFYKNDIIFAENDVGTCVYILAEGKVSIERRTLPHRPLPPKQIIIVRQGQISGEMTLFENTPRSATARAKSAVTVLMIPIEDLKTLMHKDCSLGYKIACNLAAMLSQRLRRMNEQWLNLSVDKLSLPEFEY